MVGGVVVVKTPLRSRPTGPIPRFLRNANQRRTMKPTRFRWAATRTACALRSHPHDAANDEHQARCQVSPECSCSAPVVILSDVDWITDTRIWMARTRPPPSAPIATPQPILSTATPQAIPAAIPMPGHVIAMNGNREASLSDDAKCVVLLLVFTITHFCRTWLWNGHRITCRLQGCQPSDHWDREPALPLGCERRVR